MIVIAIDPGLTGACSVIDRNGLRVVFDLPTMKIPGVGKDTMVQRKIDGHAFCRLVLLHAPADQKPVAVIEAVGAMGTGSTVQSSTSLVRSLGALETVLECLRVPLTYVQPQNWKRFYNLIDADLKPTQRKAMAMTTARALYPSCKDINRAKDHNRAESILIGHWFRRNNA